MSFLIRFARQWIAGETLDDAIIRARKANSNGLGAIINFLGEHVRDKEEAEANKNENFRILPGYQRQQNK
jgi:proline dehydrogenase